MSDLQSKSEILKKQAELLALTKEAVFTEEQAKEVLQGKITDGYLIKIKMDLDSLSGVILILVSSIKKNLMEVYSVLGNSQIFRRIRPFADYIQISTDLGDIGKAVSGYDAAMSENVGRAVHRVLNKEKMEEFLPLWAKKDPSRISESFEQAILQATKARSVRMQAEVDKISTAKFRYENPMKGIILPIPKPEEEKAMEEAIPSLSTDLAKTETSPLERQIQQYKSRYTREFKMKTVISPISGVDFDNLVEGMDILFRIPIETSEGLTTAEQLGLIDEEGKISKEPQVAKFLGIVGNKGEYHLFAEAPNGALFHSVEEQPVRVATPKVGPTGNGTKANSGTKKKPVVSNENKGGNLFLLMGGFVFLVLAGVLLFILFIL